MASLAGKVAIVTGASRGIGRAIAERLARDGASVVVNYAKNAEEAKQVVAGITNGGGNAVAVQGDVSRLADVRRLFEETNNAFHRLDILVNNAGIFLHKPVTEVTEQEFDEIFAINAKGPYFAMQEAAKRMADGGRIVNISTGGVQLAFAGISAYGGTKAALDLYTRVAAKELGARRITVNTVSPGYTDTDMMSDPLRAVGVEASPLKRVGLPKDIADVVAFVVSDEGGWLTGANIPAGGGVVI